MIVKTPFYLFTSDPWKRFLLSDNKVSYFTLSDNLNEADGYRVCGFTIFNRITFNKKKGICSKRFSGHDVEAEFEGGLSVSFALFKNGAGFSITAGKSFFIRDRRAGEYRGRTGFFIGADAEIVESSDGVIVIKYKNPDRAGFGWNELYCALTLSPNCKINKHILTEGYLDLEISKRSGSSEVVFYMLCDNSFDFIKYTSQKNITKIDQLKKHLKENFLLNYRYTAFHSDDKQLNKSLLAAFSSAESFMMRKNDIPGIWAGYPWFDNSWGRDTFISMPGICYVTGKYEDASHIIDGILEYQNLDKKSPFYGRIPNVVFAKDNILYNTADGTPLFLRELYEYIIASGDYMLAVQKWDRISLAIDEVYGKHKDENGLVRNEDADDWMDARLEGKESLSPRGDRQVEIQVLWFTVLHCAAKLIDFILFSCVECVSSHGLKKESLINKRNQFLKDADKLADSIRKLYVTPDKPFIYDHINSDGTPDLKLRPNVFLAFYYNGIKGVPQIFTNEEKAQVVKLLMSNLVFEHGVASLGRFDEDFHPHHIHQSHHKDAAYHNGAIWYWLSGPFINTMCSLGLQNTAYKHTKRLIKEMLSGDNPGTLAELCEPFIKDEKVAFSGTYSQAWSVAEFNRSVIQDYCGIVPDVADRKLYVEPALPYDVGNVNLSVRYGISESFRINYGFDNRSRVIGYIEIRAVNVVKPVEVIITVNSDNINNGNNVAVNGIVIRVVIRESGAGIKININNREATNLRI